MDIGSDLPSPLNSFVIDVPAKHYYDFELPPKSDYPLSGVTYPVDYGHIMGYTTEDGHELDLFVGTSYEGKCGTIVVFRGEGVPLEHKFYVRLTEDEVSKIVNELGPVLISHEEFASMGELLKTIRMFKD